MEVKYIDHMGTDLSVVNAARVSFSKTSEWEFDTWLSGWEYDYRLSDRDTKLVKYLASHGHWTPFGHATICLHMKLPMFVQRQMDKHQVGFVVNEVSRRYVDDTPEFYEPKEWRARPDDSIKQGSGEEMVNQPYLNPWSESDYSPYGAMYHCLQSYNRMIKDGVAPEMARMVLPMSMYTETWKTGSLYGWANVYNLRSDSHAQKEIQEVAEQIDSIIRPLFPVSWEALTN